MHWSVSTSRVAQWERAGPITQRSMDRNHPLLSLLLYTLSICYTLKHKGAKFVSII